MKPVFDLEDCTCIKCGRDISDDSVVYHHVLSTYSVCCNCAKEKPTGFCEYIVKDRTSHLVLTKYTFGKLEDSIYEIGYAENKDDTLKFYVERERSNSDSIESFYSSIGLKNLLLEKEDGHYALYFRELPIKPAPKFVTEDKCINKVLGNFTEIAATSKLLYLVDRYDNLRGISSASLELMDDLCLETYNIASKAYTLDELKVKYGGLEAELNHSLAEFTPRELYEYCRTRIKGQDSELKKAVYLVYSYLKLVAEKKRFTAQNWILTAPSGSGKTEFFRSVRDFFEEHNVPVPVSQVDLSHLTPEGYKGANATVAIPKSLVEKKRDAKGVGICFLDEADKKCLPFDTDKSWNNALQANLLTILEGKTFQVELEGERGYFEFDSGLTMFVLMGSFQELRHKKANPEPVKEKRLGFNSDIFTEDKKPEDLYDNITISDMVEGGMQEEFAGRISQVINFHKLSEEDMRDVIKSKAEEISAQIGANIELSEKAESELLKISYGALGIRNPMNKIRELAQNALAEIFFDDDFGETEKTVVIDSLTDARVKRHKTSAKTVSSEGYRYRVLVEEEY